MKNREKNYLKRQKSKFKGFSIISNLMKPLIKKYKNDHRLIKSIRKEKCLRRNTVLIFYL